MSIATEHKITFLTSAISDAQELIRFIDTKTAIIITIVGAFFVTFFSNLPTVVEYCSYLSFWFWLWQVIFILSSIVTVLITIRIIRPTNNPIDNLQIADSEKPNLKFFLGVNKYKNWIELFSNSRNSKLEIKHRDYMTALNLADSSHIIDSLTVELEKVSFIRNIKNDRFNLLVKLLFLNTIAFIISFCFITIEVNNAKTIKAKFEKTKTLQKATTNKSICKSRAGQSWNSVPLKILGC